MFLNLKPCMNLRLVALITAACLTGCSKSDSDLSAIEPSSSASSAAQSEQPSASGGADERAGSMTRASELRESQRLAEAGEFEAAAGILRKLLIVQPNDYELVFRLANLEASKGAFDEAISLLEGIPTTDAEAGLPALGQAAQWCMQIKRYDDAEKKYRKLVELIPDESLVRRELAKLLNRQGRRHEAAEHLRHLCRLGDVQQQELNELLSLSDAVYFISASPGEPEDEKPIGRSGEARCYFTERQYDKAVETLQQELPRIQAVAALNAFYGRALAEAQREKEFLEWLSAVDASTRDQAEYWAALGAYLVDQRRNEEAVRALGEAIRRDVSDARSSRRMYQALTALGQEVEAKKWFDRFRLVRDVTLASKGIGDSQGQDTQAFADLIASLERLERPLEAVMWKWLDRYYRNESPAKMSDLRQRQAKLAKSSDAFGTDGVKLCGLDLDQFPLPKLSELRSLAASSTDGTKESIPFTSEIARFENVAAAVGLDHAYSLATKPKERGFAIYQSVGGGVAVTDYDLDGLPDLYFAQGSADPPNFEATRSNVLYRNVRGKLADVTTPSDLVDRHYTVGVTAGDWNQDGFPDLVTANIGTNFLHINNGDGTFSTEPLDDLDDRTMLSTSLAIADMTGDALPDVFELNYLRDPTIARQPATIDGRTEIIAPLDFEPAMDRLHVNDAGGARRVMPISEDPAKKATGLGVVVVDFDGDGKNEAFVGNDVRSDQLWKLGQDGTFVDVAPTLGCALGAEGTVTASMGIAAGDFDQAGYVDLYITNFENEASTLLLNRGGSFRERGVQFKLAAPSIPVLGFGAQAIDYNNDGLLDIAVTNGHVENTGVEGQRFRQPPQLFASRGSYFDLLKVTDSSGYFGSEHVGRALARLDFDQDGKQDLVVTHMNDLSALLLNRTETDNHWIKIRLVGTACERDAIGAKVQISAKSREPTAREQTAWVIAGDGYLARNESVLFFGLGNSDKVDELRITWPGGQVESIRDVAVDQELLFVQGEGTAYSYGASIDQ